MVLWGWQILAHDLFQVMKWKMSMCERRRHRRKQGNTAVFEEMCMLNWSWAWKPKEVQCQGLFQNIYQKKHPTKPLQTTRLFAKLGSVLLACVFEIFYSSCIRLPGDLPISHAAQCTILPLFASLLVWQQILLMWCAWPKMCHRCRRVSEKRLWSLSDKFHMSAWGRGNMSRSSNQRGGRGSRDADYLTAVGAGSAPGVLCLGMLLGAFWQKDTYTAPFLK